jgi:hypothetical protein
MALWNSPRRRGVDGRVRSGSAGRGPRPGSTRTRHVIVAWKDGCGPALPAAGPVLAPLELATSSWRGWTGAVRLCRPRAPSWLHSNSPRRRGVDGRVRSGSAGRGTRPGSTRTRHVVVAWKDGCGPALPAAGPVLAPLEFATSSWRGWTGAVRLCRPRDPSWLHSNSPRRRGVDGRVRSGSAGRGPRPGSTRTRHVIVAWKDGCGPALPAAGPVLAPLELGGTGLEPAAGAV